MTASKKAPKRASKTALSAADPTTRLYGLDVSSPLTQDQWNCLASERNAKFAVTRCYRNAKNGEPDTSCPDNVKYALNAGLDFVDVYFYPVIESTPLYQQVDECLHFLQENQVNYRRMWLDVEGNTDSGRWYPEVNTNINFIQLFVLLMQQAGVDVGIYCGTDGWKTLTGDTSLFGDLPLWWSSHGKEFERFGGWAAPAMVQYAYDTEHCDATYDSDYVDVPRA